MKKNINNTIYMVTYLDDANRKHITFVKGFSAVKFLKERFFAVDFEPTENYYREISNQQLIHLFV